MLRVLDLFSGIGGFSLGLERTGGFKTVAFCEIDLYCRAVLKKHWPDVRQYEDVRELTAERLRADGIVPDVICGGFPCQDISEAGKRAGLDGERSGLWSEIARLVGEIRPRFLIVENVSNLLSGPSEWPGRWFGRVLGDMAEIGFDAEWHCIPASAIGAYHRRDRVWFVGYPAGAGLHASALPGVCGREETAGPRDAQSQRRSGDVANADRVALVGAAIARAERHPWPPEPCVGRVVDGLSRGLVEPRLKALGNAVVPQIPELIGQAILTATIRAALAEKRET